MRSASLPVDVLSRALGTCGAVAPAYHASMRRDECGGHGALSTLFPRVTRTRRVPSSPCRRLLPPVEAVHMVTVPAELPTTARGAAAVHRLDPLVSARHAGPQDLGKVVMSPCDLA